MEESEDPGPRKGRKKLKLKNSEIDDREDKPLLGSQKLPFPKSVFFIFLNEFCERYSFYGLEAILAIFLRNVLNYTETASTVIYHLFVTVAFTTPLLGGILGDSVLGKFKTTVYFSIVHSVGSASLAVGALPFFSLSVEVLITILALLVTAIGIGGIKPNVAAFGGDQFKLPEQADQLVLYFSIYYVSINVGATFSEIFTPILRKDVSCFGQDTCYSLAFAVPAALMVLSLVAFVMGKRMYKIKPITESVTVNAFKCISYAIGNRKEKREDGGHWLDSASDRYSIAFINDIKALFQVVRLLSPLVIFWSLWTQMGTTWTFQATRMNGSLTQSLTVKPDQIQVTNSLLILFFIPFFDTVVYPLFAKCGFLVKPIHRISLGCFLIAISFVMAGVLELQLVPSYAQIPSKDQTTFNFINDLPCSLNLTLEPVFVQNLDSKKENHKDLQSYIRTLNQYQNALLSQIPAFDYNITVLPMEGTTCELGPGKEVTFPSIEVLPQREQAQTFLIRNDTTGKGIIAQSQAHESLLKSDEGNAKCRIIGDIIQNHFYMVELSSTVNGNYSNQFSLKDQETLSFEVEPGMYAVSIIFNGTDNSSTVRTPIDSIDLVTGASYLLGIFQDPITDKISAHLYTLTKPNSVHMFWQLPQYAVLTVAEILVAVTGYHFAYEQAPLSMKSTLQSVWLLTMAGGNLIIILVVVFDIFSSQAIVFFFFAGLMLIGTWLFMFLGYHYIPRVMEQEVPTTPSQTPLLHRRHSIAEAVATGVK